MTAPRVRRPPSWLLAPTVLGAVVLLWVLAGAPWTAAAVTFGVVLVVALVAKVVGFLLPREGRWIADRGGVFGVAGALVFLVTQSSGRAVLFVGGLTVVALALPQAWRTRHVVGAVGAVVVVLGATGLIVQSVTTRAEQEATYQAEAAMARARLLPASPEEALADLMTAAARQDGRGCDLFTPAGRTAITAAYRAADCPAALHLAGMAIVDRQRYADWIDAHSIAVQLDQDGQRAAVDGCAVQWRPTLQELLYGRPAGTPDAPGPPLARIVAVTTYHGTGWAIDGLQRCP